MRWSAEYSFKELTSEERYERGDLVIVFFFFFPSEGKGFQSDGHRSWDPMVGICIYIDKTAGKPVLSRGKNEQEHTKRYAQRGNRIVEERPDH